MKPKAMTEIKLKSRCPYCHRVETLTLGWESVLVAQIKGYCYEDVQCGMCGSKYDITFSFNCRTKKRSNDVKRGTLPG